MASEAIEVGRGRDSRDVGWIVLVRDGELVITAGATHLHLEGEQRDRFAEAVARACTPGQVSDGG